MELLIEKLERQKESAAVLREVTKDVDIQRGECRATTKGKVGCTVKVQGETPEIMSPSDRMVVSR